MNRIKEVVHDKKEVMKSFRASVAAGDSRMILPSWEELEAGTAHQDETLERTVTESHNGGLPIGLKPVVIAPAAPI
eukprot:4112143-Pyramimonas_sp.AAC.1